MTRSPDGQVSAFSEPLSLMARGSASWIWIKGAFRGTGTARKRSEHGEDPPLEAEAGGRSGISLRLGSEHQIAPAFLVSMSKMGRNIFSWTKMAILAILGIYERRRL